MKPTYNCKRVMVLHLRAPNDQNGNPRRVFVVFAPEPKTGRIVLVDSFDEGYQGDRAWQKHFGDEAKHTYGHVVLEVSVSEYHAWASGRDSTSDDSPFVDPVPVMFRTEFEGPGNMGRETILAVFPSLPGVDKPGSVTMYAHVGQHSSGEYQYVLDRTRPATKEEYGPLKKELEGIGYRLRVVRNGYVFAWWRDRKADLARLRESRRPEEPKTYTDGGTTYLELHAMRAPVGGYLSEDSDDYEAAVEAAVEAFQTEHGVTLYALGRSGRHICVEDTEDNRERYAFLRDAAIAAAKQLWASMREPGRKED